MIEEYVYEREALPPELKCQIVSFLRIVWPDGFVGENRQRDWISRPEYHARHVVLVEGGLIVAHTEVVWHDLEHAGETYRAYGLSGVFTYPQFRGEGHGKRVVEAGTALIDAAEDADVGMLWCVPELETFYSQCGWTPIPSAVTMLEGNGQWQLNEDEILLMRFLSQKGRRGRAAFEHETIYFFDYTW